MKYSKRLLLSLMLSMTFQSIAAETWKGGDFLVSLVNEVKSSATLPSATAVVVVKDDRIVYEGYFGYQDIAERRPADENTLFYLASATKPLSALNFLLDAQTRPELATTTMSQMFPSFEVDSRKEVTVEQLLTHTASINNLPLVLATAYSGVHTSQSLRDIISQLSTASSEPVGQFKYTNVGYNIYSAYVDELFAKSWQQKLADQVFAPAGMTSTTALRSSIDDLHHIARSYSLPRENNNQALYLEKSDATLHAAGGVYSTARDMARFLTAQLNEGKLDGKQVYPAAVIASSHIEQVEASTSYGDFTRNGYAWGWYTGSYKGQSMLHHFGGYAGVHAHLSFMPEQKIGLVVLNGEDFLSSRLTGLIADYVYGELLEEENNQSRLLKRVEALNEKLVRLDTMISKEKQKISAREWQLSLPAKQYVGEYSHPLLGTIYIQLNDHQRFDVEWGGLHSDSTGMNIPDQIRVSLDPTSGSVIEFVAEHNVTALRYTGIEFFKL